jgi:hypothetical protein
MVGMSGVGAVGLAVRRLAGQVVGPGWGERGWMRGEGGRAGLGWWGWVGAAMGQDKEPLAAGQATKDGGRDLDVLEALEGRRCLLTPH